MSRASWDKRLRAIEARPSAQKPLRIVGGLPSGSEMIESLGASAARPREPLCPTLAEAEHESATTDSPLGDENRFVSVNKPISEEVRFNYVAKPNSEATQTDSPLPTGSTAPKGALESTGGLPPVEDPNPTRAYAQVGSTPTDGAV
jgi:hypothetical protein